MTVASDESARINLSWLIRLRWGACTGQLATVCVAATWLRADIAVGPLLLLIALAAASNLAATWWLRSTSQVRETAIVTLMGFDVLLLTGLLSFSGASSNPFSSLYLVNIALAAVVLRPLWTWALVALSLVCFAALFFEPRAWVGAPLGAMHPGHGPPGELHLHLEGMWVAFGVAASFIVYFVQRVTRALGHRERELAEAREATVRAERLASLATLAAGAAHELATPLSTIAVVARELERSLAALPGGALAQSDAGLIRDEVDRCSEILAQMAADAGESTGEDFVPTTLATLLAAAAADVPEDERLSLHISPADSARTVVVPIRALAQALRAVIKNALAASPPESEIEVRVATSPKECRIDVVDFGSGMSPEVSRRAFEPFFTTKEPGKGMGLGLFLARTVLERLGGGIELRSRPGEGTTASLTFAAGMRSPRDATPQPAPTPDNAGAAADVATVAGLECRGY